MAESQTDGSNESDIGYVASNKGSLSSKDLLGLYLRMYEVEELLRLFVHPVDDHARESGTMCLLRAG